MTQVTARQLEVLRIASDFINSNGYSPAIRELMPLLGINSIAGVVNHLHVLEKKGLVARATGKCRSLRLTEAGRAALEEEVRN